MFSFSPIGLCLSSLVLAPLVFCATPLTAQAPVPPNALQRLAALHLPKLEGPIPVYYSDGIKLTAVRDQAEVSACAAWWSTRLHATVPVTVAVLNKPDWDRIGSLEAYPMAEAMPNDGSVMFMPASFDTFPGQNEHADLAKKLDFIAFHETGHLFQHALGLDGPDLFMQEFNATMLAAAYALAARPELVAATLDSRAAGAAKPPFTSFEDMDLLGIGVGFDSYDWLQVETVRLAAFFVKDEDLAALVHKLNATFPPGQTLPTKEVFAKLDTIRPGFLAQAGDLARPSSLPLIAPGPCLASPKLGGADAVVGIRNLTGHAITTLESGQHFELPPGDSAQFGKVGGQFQLPSGTCVTYPASPAFVELR